MIRKIDAKLLCEVYFMYWAKFLLDFNISVQKIREKIWVTCRGDTQFVVFVIHCMYVVCHRAILGACLREYGIALCQWLH